jgi:hypothetical protein
MKGILFVYRGIKPRNRKQFNKERRSMKGQSNGQLLGYFGNVFVEGLKEFSFGYFDNNYNKIQQI